jgi:uncharacterized phiE125 gp8 family phage protein
MGIKIITAASAMPLSMDDLCRHLKLDPTEALLNEAAELSGWLSDAVAYAQDVTGRALGVQTLELALDAFPTSTTGTAIDLPLSPVTSITSVIYLDTAGVLTPIDAANYALDDYGMVHRLVPAYGYTWPTAQATINAVKVRYVAGTAALPGALRSALLLIVGHWYANREAGNKADVSNLPLGVVDLLNTQKVWSV